MDLDIDFIRRQFPAFSEPSLAGQAFFENAGGSYTCGQVIDRLQRFYTQGKVQPYYPFPASRAAGAEMDEARDRLARFMGVAFEEVTFGPSTTQNAYVLAQAFREMLSPGDVIVVTNQDHEANSGPWRRLAKQGIVIREWTVDPDTGHLDPADLAPLLDGNVKLVCLPHCSNVVGEINPVAEIADQAHAAGAWVCVDGVSYAPHGIPNVGALGADIYMYSSYKTWGPHQGILVVRRPLLEQLPNQAHYFNGDTLYKRLVPAGPDHAQVAACAGMVDYFEAVHAHHFATGATGARLGEEVHALFTAYERKLLQPLLDYLVQKNTLRLIGPASAEKRAPTVSVLTEEPAEAVSAKLSASGIMAGGGNYYAVRLLEGLGIDPAHGVVRLSFSHYTAQAEIDQLIDALDRVL